MIEHQPRHKHRKYVRGKGDLKHGLVMRTYHDVVPTSQGHGKTFADPSAQALGLGACRRRIVVDMGMIACDLGNRSRAVALGQLGTPNAFRLPWRKSRPDRAPIACTPTSRGSRPV